MTKTITLTHDQANDLYCYLLMSTKYRKGERKVWDELAEEKKTDGTPKHANAESNAQFWAEMESTIGEILGIIDAAPLTD